MFNNICYFNWKFDSYKNFNVWFLSNSLNFWTWIIESIRVYRKNDNYYFIWLDYYIDRFLKSNLNTFYDFNITKQEIKILIIKLIKLNKSIQNPYFRLVTFFWDDDLNIIQNKSNFNFAIWTMDLKVPEINLSSTFSSFWREESLLNKYKLAMNYWRNLVDLYEAKSNWFDSVIYLSKKWNILEMISENIFLIKEWIVYTPKEWNILNWINRKMIIFIFQNKLWFKVEEIDIHKDSIFDFDEVFICWTATWIRSINKVNNKIIWNNKDYKITDKIRKFYDKDIFNCKKIDNIVISKFEL